MIDAVTFYENLGSDYFQAVDAYKARYHEIRLNTASGLLAKHGHRGTLFDFACGSGEMFPILHGLGFATAGCDKSAAMVRLARKHSDKVLLGGVEILEESDASYDAILALNVLAFLSEDDERRFFLAASRRLKYGGVLLVSHANALLDLVTFNRYTIEFYREQIIAKLDIDDPDEALSGVTDLLAEPGHPAFGAGSVRDHVPKRCADPFTYARGIEEYGFSLLAEAHILCHPLPPKISQSRPDWRMEQLESHQKLNDTLRRVFCSQFQMIFRRQ